MAMNPINIEVRVTTRSAEALAEALAALESLAEDFPYRDEVRQMEDALIIITNEMVFIHDDRITGRLHAERI
jgi:hypothetical protein